MANSPLARAIGLCAIAATITGCSSMTPQEAGYVLGALAGGAVGSAPGAAAGALLGTAAGSLLAKPIEAARERKERQGLEDRLNAPGASPSSIAASPEALPSTTPQSPPPVATARERIWIDEQVVGGRVVPGHFAEHAVPATAWHAEASTSSGDRSADTALQPTL